MWEGQKDRSVREKGYRCGREKDRSERKGERQGWERERIKEIQGGREKDRTRDRGGTERERKKKMKRETVAGETKIEIGRETRVRDR